MKCPAIVGAVEQDEEATHVKTLEASDAWGICCLGLGNRFSGIDEHENGGPPSMVDDRESEDGDFPLPSLVKAERIRPKMKRVVWKY